MTYEKPAVLATYQVEELMQDAAVCVVYQQPGNARPRLTSWIGEDGASHPSSRSPYLSVDPA